MSKLKQRVLLGPTKRPGFTLQNEEETMQFLLMFSIDLSTH